MQFFGDPHPEVPTPFSFLTITIHDTPLSDSLKGGGKFSTLWEFCGKNVGKTRSHHQFAARWRNRRKSGNLSTKKPTFQSVVIKNGGGRWIRTIESCASRFTVCPLWPLGNPTDRNGAGKGGRTPITSLEGWCTAVMPYPQFFTVYLVPSGGVEPPLR